MDIPVAFQAVRIKINFLRIDMGEHAMLYVDITKPVDDGHMHDL